MSKKSLVSLFKGEQGMALPINVKIALTFLIKTDIRKESYQKTMLLLKRRSVRIVKILLIDLCLIGLQTVKLI
jgi:hypothetical protein